MARDRRVDDRDVSDDLVLFDRPKHLELTAPQIKMHAMLVSDGVHEVTLRSDVPALYVWLELAGAVFTDTFFYLLPGVERTLSIDTSNLGLLRVRSLTPTYRA